MTKRPGLDNYCLLKILAFNETTIPDNSLSPQTDARGVFVIIKIFISESAYTYNYNEKKFVKNLGDGKVDNDDRKIATRAVSKNR